MKKLGRPKRYGAPTDPSSPSFEKYAEALHASLSRAPHILLGRDDGGMTLPPVESVVQSYASLAASLDAASFPPLTRRKPVSTLSLSDFDGARTALYLIPVGIIGGTSGG